MKAILKLIELLGGFEGIRKVVDGKKTYLSAVAGILIAAGYAVFDVYQFGEKTIDANTLWDHLTICGTIISVQATFVFNRMAQAKTHAAIVAQQDQAQKIHEANPDFTGPVKP